MNALAIQETAALAHSFETMERMAHAIAKSGLFGMKSTEQALALMLVAQAEGQHPATITQEYDIIQGRAARKTHSVLARFQAAGGKVEWHELSHTKADATFSHPQGGSVRLDWTIEQAKTAKLAGKDNWVGYARAMLRARVIAEGIRAVYPAALGGMLVVEEAQDLPQAPASGSATAEPKHMGAVEVVETPAPAVFYPDSDFEANLPTWTKIMAAGKVTADSVIAKINSAPANKDQQLSDAQKARIRAAQPGAKPADDAGQQQGGAPAMTEADVQRQMDDSKDRDSLNEAAALIDAISDPAARGRLNTHFDVRNAELS
jgi:hypothetical protein